VSEPTPPWFEMPVREAIAYGVVVAISSWGGIVAYINRVRAGREFSLSELIGELTTSAFCGVLTYWFCQWAGLNPYLTAALVGISGHMGSRGLALTERYMLAAARKWLDVRFGLRAEGDQKEGGDSPQ